MPELSLQDVDGDAFADELDGVTVAELMRRNAPTESALTLEFSQLVLAWTLRGA